MLVIKEVYTVTVQTRSERLHFSIWFRVVLCAAADFTFCSNVYKLYRRMTIKTQ